MNLWPEWEPLLRSYGIAATHWSRVGVATVTDQQMMVYAAERGSIVLTHDLDFGAMLAATKGLKPSVVQIRSDDLRPNIIGPRVAATILAAEKELEADALATIDAQRARLRLLPLITDTR